MSRAQGARARGGEHLSRDNRDCSLFLGVHVAEGVLRHVFKNVEVMPHGNIGYDFICNHGKKIDVKSSCHKDNGWMFHIRHNIVADYFLCLAFDNREDLTPLGIWLLPGAEFAHLDGARITPNKFNKWDEYKLDIERVITCCDTIRSK
jgi:hypothetical protein